MSAVPRSSFPSAVIAVLGAFAVVAFARTYYLKFLFDSPPLAVAAHVHGLLATLWLALHFTQARLVAAHRVDIHRKLGIVAAVTGFALAGQSFALGVMNVAAGRAPPGRDPLQFLSMPVCTSTIFAVFLAAALLFRKRREWHRRLMLLATLNLVVPAAGRFDFFLKPLGVPRGLLGVIVMSAILVWACLRDRNRTGQVHPIYLWGGGLLVASAPARMWLGMQPWWIPIAKILVS